MALMQDDIKKVLAYSSISQMGYILFGLGSESILGITGGTMMYVTHGLGKAILFMMACSIILQTGTRSMSKLGGLAGKMPYTAVIAMIGALTIIGIPPTSGFMAEWILFSGVLQTSVAQMDPLRTTMFALGILTTVLSSAYILWMYKRIFFGKIPEQLAHVKDPNWYITATMGVLGSTDTHSRCLSRFVSKPDHTLLQRCHVSRTGRRVACTFTRHRHRIRGRITKYSTKFRRRSMMRI